MSFPIYFTISGIKEEILGPVPLTKKIMDKFVPYSGLDLALCSVLNVKDLGPLKLSVLKTQGKHGVLKCISDWIEGSAIEKGVVPILVQYLSRYIGVPVAFTIDDKKETSSMQFYVDRKFKDQSVNFFHFEEKDGDPIYLCHSGNWRKGKNHDSIYMNETVGTWGIKDAIIDLNKEIHFKSDDLFLPVAKTIVDKFKKQNMDFIVSYLRMASMDNFEILINVVKNLGFDLVLSECEIRENMATLLTNKFVKKSKNTIHLLYDKLSNCYHSLTLRLNYTSESISSQSIFHVSSTIKPDNMTVLIKTVEKMLDEKIDLDALSLQINEMDLEVDFSLDGVVATNLLILSGLLVFNYPLTMIWYIGKTTDISIKGSTRELSSYLGPIVQKDNSNKNRRLKRLELSLDHDGSVSILHTIHRNDEIQSELEMESISIIDSSVASFETSPLIYTEMVQNPIYENLLSILPRVIPQIYSFPANCPLIESGLGNPQLPDVFVRRLESHVEFSIVFNDSNGKDSMYLDNRLSYVTPIEKIKNVIHDFTFSLFTDESDVSFKKLGLNLPDTNNDKSPDFMHLSDSNGRSNLYVVEFSTRLSPREEALRDAITDKRFKYEDMLIERSKAYHLHTLYCVIVVNANSVLSNIKSLSSTTADKLMYRYRLGCKMANALNSININIDEYMDLNEQTSRARSIFESIQLSDDSFCKPMSKELYSSFTKPMTDTELDYVREMISLSYERNETYVDIIQDQVEDPDHHMKESLEEMDEYISQYIQDTIEIPSRTDYKASIQIPLVVVKPKESSETINRKEIISSLLTLEPTTMRSVWMKAINSAESSIYTDTGSKPFKEELLEAQFAFADYKEDEEKMEVKKERSTYNRIHIDLSAEEVVELASSGVNGKKHRTLPSIAIHKEFSRRGFSYTQCPTDDIEDFMQEECLEYFESMKDHEDFRSESVLRLLAHSAKMHENQDSSRFINTLEHYSRSYYGLYMRLISDIGTELSLSLAQYTGENQYIFKELKHFPVYLLIKSTTRSGPIFFSMLIQTKNILKHSKNTLFKKTEHSNDILITPFVSSNSSKLTNLIRAESFGLSMFSFWNELFFNKCWDSPLEEVSRSCPDASKMLWLTTLVLLNDKHQTEEAITNSRYIFMESFVEFPAKPKPHKMIKKYPTIIRSRLELWIIRKLELAMRHYIRFQSRSVVRDGERVWENLINPYLSTADATVLLDNQDQLVNLMYMGYPKNKDETPELNSQGKLLEKIVAFEDELPDSHDYLGLKDPPQGKCGKHEFSQSFVKYICDRAIIRLRDRLGVRNPKDYLGDQILKSFTNQFMESLSSLKASSNFGYECYIYQKDRKYTRSKVIEKVIKILLRPENKDKDKVRVMDYMREILVEIEKTGALHIDIFQKNQHGGLREIYVMDINGRILQKCIEDMSRSILCNFDSETMTHPKNKFRLPENHNREAIKVMGKNYITYAASDDGAKWNQNHHVIKFILMMVRLTPDYMHGFLVRSMQMWFKKRIMVPPHLLDLFEELDDFQSTSPIIQRVFNVYKGYEKSHWMEKSSTFIQTESGFMQGILHYTSSLFHTLLLDDYSERESERLERVMKRDYNMHDARALVQNMQSSDDSAILISIPSKDNIFNLRMACECHKSIESKSFVSQLVGIIMSVKCTRFTKNMHEFNSEFCYRGHTFRPTIRWINASVTVSEQETLVARQEEQYNLTTSIIEGGGTFVMSAMCHLSQSLLHYRLLGSSVSELWPIYSLMITECPDPALGYWLVDHPFATGMSGYNYLLWLSCMKTSLGPKYKKMYEEEINQVSDGIKNITKETISLGPLSRSTLISFNNKQRWMKLYTSLGLPEKWEEEIDSRPEVLYLRPTSTNDTILKLAVTVKSPGVIASLGKGNALPRIIASSVYILSRAVLHTKSAYYTNLVAKSGDSFNKIALVKELLRQSVDMQRVNITCPDYVGSTNLSFNSTRVGRPLGMISSNSNLNCYETDHNSTALIELIYRYLTRTANRLTMKQLKSLLISFKTFLSMHGYQNAYIFDSDIDNKALSLVSMFFKVRLCIVEGSLDRITYIEDNETLEQWDKLIIRIDKNNDRMIILDVYIRDGQEISGAISHSNRFTPEEEAFLFPNSSDYEMLRVNYSQLKLSYLKPGRNMRMRIRSDVHIAGADDQSNFKLDHVLMWKWWGKNIQRASHTAYNIMFEKYKALIPWLSDTPNETLKKSPFTNHIQMQNFFARQSKKRRVVHLVGSLGKTRHGTSNLISIIRENFSSTCRFDGVHDIGMKFKADTSNSLSHILTMLSSCPLEKSFKMSLICDNLIRSPKIAFNPTSVKSRANKLALFQDFCRKDPQLMTSLVRSIGTIESEMIRRYRIILATPCLSEEEFYENQDKLQDVLDGITVGDGEELDLEYSYSILKERFGLSDTEVETQMGTYDEYRETISIDDDQIKEAVDADLSCFQNLNIINMYLLNDIGDMTLRQYYVKVKQESEAELLDLYTSITKHGLGCYGTYERTQRFDKSKGHYVGSGVWSGKFHDVSVKIGIGNENGINKLCFVVVNNLSDRELILSTLTKWCEDNHIENSTKPGANILRESKMKLMDLNLKSSDLIGNVLNFDFTISKGLGAEFYLCKQFFDTQHEKISKISLDVGPGSLRLVGHYSTEKTSSRQLTILSLSLNERHLEKKFNIILKDDFEAYNDMPKWIQDWVNWVQSDQFVNSLLPSLETTKDFGRYKLDRDEFYTWVHSITKSIVINAKKTTFSDVADSKEMIKSSYDRRMIDEDNMLIELKKELEKFTEADLSKIISGITFDEEDADLFVEEMVNNFVYKNIRTPIEYGHPLLNGFFNKIGIDKLMSFRDKAMSNVIIDLDPNDFEFVFILSVCFAIPQSSFRRISISTHDTSFIYPNW